jgi:hypothetical protein
VGKVLGKGKKVRFFRSPSGLRVLSPVEEEADSRQNIPEMVVPSEGALDLKSQIKIQLQNKSAIKTYPTSSDPKACPISKIPRSCR